MKRFIFRVAVRSNVQLSSVVCIEGVAPDLRAQVLSAIPCSNIQVERKEVFVGITLVDRRRPNLQACLLCMYLYVGNNYAARQQDRP